MPGARLKLRGDLRAVTNSVRLDIAKLVTGAFRDGAKSLKERGRASIAGGGFGGKWQSLFVAKAYPKSGYSISPQIWGHHKIGYAGEFQEPDTIGGKPLLWLPIEKNLPAGGSHWKPKNFPGPLRGGRRGAGGRPLLFGQVAVGRGGVPLKRKPRAGAKVHKVWLPVFVGVPAVRDPKRFNLYEAADVVAEEIVSKLSQD